MSKTGAHTFFGRAATLVGQKHKPGRIEQLVTRIAMILIIVTMLLVVVVIAVTASRPPLPGESQKDFAFRILAFATLVLLSGIPLGLNAVLSVTMAVGVRVMARNKVIVSRMTAIEDLAGTDILCSDKTGTLTKNELTMGEPILYAPYTVDDLYLYAALASQVHDGDVIDTAIGACCSLFVLILRSCLFYVRFFDYAFSSVHLLFVLFFLLLCLHGCRSPGAHLDILEVNETTNLFRSIL